MLDAQIIGLLASAIMIEISRAINFIRNQNCDEIDCTSPCKNNSFHALPSESVDKISANSNPTCFFVRLRTSIHISVSVSGST